MGCAQSHPRESRSSAVSLRAQRLKNLVTFSLLISEDFWLFLDSPAIARLSGHLSEGTKTMRSLGKRRKPRNRHQLARKRLTKKFSRSPFRTDFSSENENFKPSTHQGLFFMGELQRSRLKIGDESFQARLNISSETVSFPPFLYPPPPVLMCPIQSK